MQGLLEHVSLRSTVPLRRNLVEIYKEARLRIYKPRGNVSGTFFLRLGIYGAEAELEGLSCMPSLVAHRSMGWRMFELESRNPKNPFESERGRSSPGGFRNQRPACADDRGFHVACGRFGAVDVDRCGSASPSTTMSHVFGAWLVDCVSLSKDS